MNKLTLFLQLFDKLPVRHVTHGGSKHDASKPQVLQENPEGKNPL